MKKEQKGNLRMPNQFLTNYTEVTFLNKLKNNLRHCNSFDFSVSFIKRAGLILLYKDIEAALERGCKGRILTSTYQNFTDIESLNSFFALMGKCPNFQCHLDYDSFHDNGYITLGYHSKGYLFEFDDHRELIVGSSNITRYALLKNIEWDVAVSDHYESGVYDEAKKEFEEKWAATELLDNELIKKYSTKLNYAVERWDMDYDLSVSKIKPNYMQKKALKELNRYRALGVNRALIIASAGSGKTYLAAFDALNFNPKRLLYIVHEGSILKKSLETFQEVFGNQAKYGIYSGTSKESCADFVFATNITMSNTLDLFEKDEFDYIVIDECHHATAQTYKKISARFIGRKLCYPKHVDYINNDCAPDLIRFMSVKTQNRKNCSYYNFLKGIGEENLPLFTERQIAFANYLSGLLPLVRVHEYQIVKYLLTGQKTYQELETYLKETIPEFAKEQLNHALKYLQFTKCDESDNNIALDVAIDDQFLEYIEDLIEYGLTRYVIDIGSETEFKLWQTYRMDQVQLKLLKNPANNQVGTYYYDDYVVIFASLKKDLDEADKLNYKDKFLQSDLFQWESMNSLPQSHLEKLIHSKFAYVFIRKVTSENGLVLPFTYVGKGKLTNPRKTSGGNGTYLFDIQMENMLPEYLQYDFGLTKE